MFLLLSGIFRVLDTKLLLHKHVMQLQLLFNTLQSPHIFFVVFSQYLQHLEKLFLVVVDLNFVAIFIDSFLELKFYVFAEIYLFIWDHPRDALFLFLSEAPLVLLLYLLVFINVCKSLSEQFYVQLTAYSFNVLILFHELSEQRNDGIFNLWPD